MRLTLILALGALAAATPAAAQNEAAPPTNDVAPVATNDVAAPSAGTPTDAAAAPGAQPATLPPDSNAAAVDTAVTEDRDDGGDRFPWGLIGLVGLVGLLGRRRSAS